ncbi:DUF4351 domain-containing protein [Nostoc sp. DedQUE09]|uniref:DUF4351 domain-containing protein n=1 Tax=Nostoc sp. DedQUE09 TaxID=3075394 RepID=UPI002AD505C7|nr:DUF4351 domain-containing protein [Nostoc sp. DedQUE09]MDZ7956011.1 DUF4351 domain-containing protein [Nostoc sp. DedQUE09]
MTRFIHDQFAKDYLEELLKPYGEVQGSSRVAGEVREIDVLFSPLTKQSTNLETLGLLGRFAATAAIFEPFRNAASKEEICDCLLKLLEVRSGLQRQVNRNKTSISELELPKLWILTPTASTTLLSGFGATQKVDWLPGVHFIAEYLRTAIVAIHQLPRTQETLWLRILGRGTVQKQAIDELEALPLNHPFRRATLELLYNLRQNLQVNQNSEEDDQELIMRLKPLYQQDREQAIQEGNKQGEQRLIIRLLNRRFGEIDSSTIERVQELSIEQLEALGEALLDFSVIADLEAWLNQQIE